jgi:hypothetical protein
MTITVMISTREKPGKRAERRATGCRLQATGAALRRPLSLLLVVAVPDA